VTSKLIYFLPWHLKAKKIVRALATELEMARASTLQPGPPSDNKKLPGLARLC